MAESWYNEVKYYAQYGDEPRDWRPVGRPERWARFAQMARRRPNPNLLSNPNPNPNLKPEP